jgi:hypothetical protein
MDEPPLVEVRRAAGLVFGYGLLVLALLAAVNALRIGALGLLGSFPVTDTVFSLMVNLGAALVVGAGGYVTLQRVGGIEGYGVDLDWGRVLGP